MAQQYCRGVRFSIGKVRHGNCAAALSVDNRTVISETKGPWNKANALLYPPCFTALIVYFCCWISIFRLESYLAIARIPKSNGSFGNLKPRYFPFDTDTSNRRLAQNCTQRISSQHGWIDYEVRRRNAYLNVKVFQTAYISIVPLLLSDIQRLTIHVILHCETDRFRLRNGPF